MIYNQHCDHPQACSQCYTGGRPCTGAPRPPSFAQPPSYDQPLPFSRPTPFSEPRQPSPFDTSNIDPRLLEQDQQRQAQQQQQPSPPQPLSYSNGYVQAFGNSPPSTGPGGPNLAQSSYTAGLVGTVFDSNRPDASSSTLPPPGGFGQQHGSAAGPSSAGPSSAPGPSGFTSDFFPPAPPPAPSGFTSDFFPPTPAPAPSGFTSDFFPPAPPPAPSGFTSNYFPTPAPGPSSAGPSSAGPSSAGPSSAVPSSGFTSNFFPNGVPSYNPFTAPNYFPGPAPAPAPNPFQAPNIAVAPNQPPPGTALNPVPAAGPSNNNRDDEFITPERRATLPPDWTAPATLAMLG
ncbi:hypothetical protein GL218_03552 [Daldinia childiae]|uniref:uncharacterized protein n=1 Tax=Daldinia childiae TaxID=326645 RepID=UPI001446353B|nr:uncharacterized protein GL218_03552 [Daldinia childiae]KAF3061525.1 hypothetical protein GL218_03552 [Daldinia childiae]